MKTILSVCLVCSSVLFIHSVIDPNTITKQEHKDGYVNAYNTPLRTSYTIGAYDPSKPYMECLDSVKTQEFLINIITNYKSSDIIEVDGLKWKKASDEYWEPYPNPPEPVLEKGEDAGVHLCEYRNWIKTHPHFGYPPLPE